MTAHRRNGFTAAGRRLLDAEDMARISPLPPPEEVFLDWLLSVPHGADLELAARRQIALIDATQSHHPDVECLRLLLVSVAGGAPWRASPARF